MRTAYGVAQLIYAMHWFTVYVQSDIISHVLLV